MLESCSCNLLPDSLILIKAASYGFCDLLSHSSMLEIFLWPTKHLLLQDLGFGF